MAGRPPKEGIDYSEWDVNLFDDPKIERLIDSQGATGFLVYFYLCQQAYAQNGYYLTWGYEHAASSARRVGGGVSSKAVESTVRLCLRLGLFHDSLFVGHEILTGRGIQKRMTPQQLTEGLDQTKPILVLDHEPDELSELAAAGADLDLSGHTHDGQLFPANLIVSMVWENSCGYLEKDGMHSIVTSGVGVFGPNMRVGTKSEICVIDCHFQ